MYARVQGLLIFTFILFFFIVSGDKHEGSKRNLKFQSAMWSQASSQYFFFLVTFLS
jgi:hypothetical protein